jgi:hypothetical protein
MRNVRKSGDSHSDDSYRFASRIRLEGKCCKNHRVATATYAILATFSTFHVPQLPKLPQIAPIPRTVYFSINYKLRTINYSSLADITDLGGTDAVAANSAR